MNRQGIVVIAAVGALAACEGALTAHVDTVAKAGSQELTVDRLGNLLGGAAQIPIQGPQGREVAKNLANLWVDYQLLGVAAAKGDSLTDPKTVDRALWALVQTERIRKLGEQMLAKMPIDSTQNASKYGAGDVLSARHILIAFPQKEGGPPGPPPEPSQAVKDSLRKKAESVRAQVTTGNFAQMAQKNSGDPGSAARGGDLGLFMKGQMLPQFEKGLLALQPGQISPVIETAYGYHIIYRPTYGEVSGQLAPAMQTRGRQVAESTYLANLEKTGKVEVKDDAPLWAKSVASDVEGHMNDGKVLATSTAGDLKASRVAEWIAALPSSQQMRAQIQNAPDSIVKMFVRQLARQELLIKQADSAKITLDTAAMTNLRKSFVAAVQQAWSGLGIAPATMKDSAKSESDRTKLAATRIESYLDRLTQQRAEFVQVPVPIERALRGKFDWKINDAGLDRALEKAAQVRVAHDSSRSAGQPPTAVPLPGGPPAGPATPAPQAPAPGTKRP